jgi:hypothetical protein
MNCLLIRQKCRNFLIKNNEIRYSILLISPNIFFPFKGFFNVVFLKFKYAQRGEKCFVENSLHKDIFVCPQLVKERRTLINQLLLYSLNTSGYATLTKWIAVYSSLHQGWH